VPAARPQGIHGQVVQLLGNRIVSGDLAPGETLDLPALERELGVSHTVLRESLRVLGTKGLVSARQKRGTFITDPQSWDMLDEDVLRWRAGSDDSSRLFDELAEVRLIIEPAAARLAAMRARPADLAALEAALEQMRCVAAAGQVAADAAAEADIAFHGAVLRATHNRLIAGLRGVIEQGLRERDLIVHAEPDADDPLPGHREVADAIARKDPDEAGAAMRSLLDDASRHFSYLSARRARRHQNRGGNNADHRS
jgi:GntR family transcriptional regulator, galactonate operon transcriptional repressor